MSTRDVKPRSVEQKTWDQWTKYWKTEEFHKKSSIGKRNRNRDGKGMVNHTGGSQTFDVLLKRLWEQNIFPDPAKFHELTHTRKKKPEAAYTSKKEEALSQLQSEAEASGSTMPSDLPLEHKIILFKDAAEGEKKSGVYGSGSAGSVFYPKKDGGSSSSTARLSSADKVVEIEQKVIHLENTLKRERDERDEAINKAVNKAVDEAVGNVNKTVDEAVSNAIKETELRMYKMMKAIVGNRQQRYEVWDNEYDTTENDD